MENDNKHMEHLERVTKSLMDRIDFIIGSDTLHKGFMADYKRIVKNGTKIAVEQININEE